MDRRIRANARATETGRRLMEVPGVGPLLASALVAAIPDPKAFRSGRNLAAWIGLVPRPHMAESGPSGCGLLRGKADADPAGGSAASERRLAGRHDLRCSAAALDR
jgi:transposase